jgi:hypothetical protein
VALSCSQQLEPPEAYERKILQAERTADVKVLDQLLAPDCVTIGPDGLRHSKAEILKIVSSIPPQNVTENGLISIPLDDSNTVVNYQVRAAMADGSVREHTATSVWTRTAKGWQMKFHQGTTIPR